MYKVPLQSSERIFAGGIKEEEVVSGEDISGRTIGYNSVTN